MEVAARELIPALISQAPAGHTLHGVRQPRGRRGKGRTLGRAAAGGDRAGERARPRAVGARRADAAADPSRARGRRAGPQPREHRSAVGTLSPRRYRPRPDLRALPGGPCGDPRQGHAGARAGGRPSLRSRDRRFAAARATIWLRCLASPPSASTSCRWVSGACAASSRWPSATSRARLDLGERRVVLSVSAKRPHKNLLALIGAFARLPAEDRPVLVLPGYPTAHESQLRERASALGIAEDVRFPAWLSSAELEGLWAITRVFVFPSLYEGFGLPVLEAMARGVPVACSNASAPARGRRRGGAAVRPTRRAGDHYGYGPPARRRRAARTARGAWARTRAGVHVGAQRAPDARLLPAHARPRLGTRASVAGEHHLQRGLQRQALGVLCEPAARCSRAAPCRRQWTRTIASATASGSELAAIVPLTPSTISSVAALSSPATTTLGVPCAAASTTTSP